MRVTPAAIHRLALGAFCAALLALGARAAPAHGDSADPLFVFYASEEREGPAHKPYPSPGSGFEGPCGLAVDPLGGFYVADYYHHAVDALGLSLKTLAQLTGEDPLDGPCGLAVASGPSGSLYVNNFHRNVVKFTPSAFPLTSFAPYGSGTVIDSNHPTGVAVNQATGNVYVDDRTYVAVYEPSGAPLLQIGAGSLEDGYGVAVSAFPATAGYVYVADAATDTVKVYDPAVDTEEPVATIDGHETPEGRFVSLRDAAVAVDRANGRVYIADDLQPEYFERPEAAVYAFAPSGAYAGRLKFNLVDARPPGLAVDNSANATQGRVYVTSGNTEEASVYAYAPGALTKSVVPAMESGASPPPAAIPNVAAPGAVSSIPAAAATAPAAVTTGPPSSHPAANRRRDAKHHRHHRHPPRLIPDI